MRIKKKMREEKKRKREKKERGGDGVGDRFKEEKKENEREWKIRKT